MLQSAVKTLLTIMGYGESLPGDFFTGLLRIAMASAQWRRGKKC